MNIVPIDKHDLESVERLNEASNEEITPYLPELIEWVQDINWPVAFGVAERLRNCGSEIAPHIKNVLATDDNTFKYNVLAHIVSHLNKECIEPLLEELTRIKEKPTEGEIEEEVTLVANNAIGVYKFNA